jgi:hypothetical protein
MILNAGPKVSIMVDGCSNAGNSHPNMWEVFYVVARTSKYDEKYKM